MDRIRKAAALIAVLGLITAALITGCEQGNSPGNGQGNGLLSPGNGSSEQTPPPSDSPPGSIVSSVPVATAPGLRVEKNDKAIVDFSNKQDGYVMARFHAKSNMQVRVLINLPDEIEYTYRLTPGGDFQVLPLSGGNGKYQIRVLEQVDGTRYATVLAVTVDVTLTDEFAPFLRPNQFVNFNKDSEVVRIAAELTAGADDLMDKIRAVYGFVITHIDYDFELAATVQSGYIPNLDKVLERGLGICFDYAAVMTAMLRSRGIPTKMVFGYANEAYHAWISVYSDETGWIDELIFFDGKTWKLMDPTFAASGDAADVAAFIGDGSRYREKFLY